MARIPIRDWFLSNAFGVLYLISFVAVLFLAGLFVVLLLRGGGIVEQPPYRYLMYQGRVTNSPICSDDELHIEFTPRVGEYVVVHTDQHEVVVPPTVALTNMWDVPPDSHAELTSKRTVRVRLSETLPPGKYFFFQYQRLWGIRNIMLRAPFEVIECGF